MWRCWLSRLWFWSTQLAFQSAPVPLPLSLCPVTAFKTHWCNFNAYEKEEGGDVFSYPLPVPYFIFITHNYCFISAYICNSGKAAIYMFWVTRLWATRIWHSLVSHQQLRYKHPCKSIWKLYCIWEVYAYCLCVSDFCANEEDMLEDIAFRPVAEALLVPKALCWGNHVLQKEVLQVGI